MALPGLRNHAMTLQPVPAVVIGFGVIDKTEIAPALRRLRGALEVG